MKKWEQIRDLKLKLTGARTQADKLEAKLEQAKLLVRNLERRRQEHVDRTSQLLTEIARLENG